MLRPMTRNTDWSGPSGYARLGSASRTDSAAAILDSTRADMGWRP